MTARLLIVVLWLLPLVGHGQQAATPERRELIYCADLMSHEEREAYRQRMRAAPGRAERDALREDHRRDMQERARQAGRAGQCETAGRQWRGGRGR